jgi:RimJ/RimL family protein N-acetyltransferase
MNTATGRSRDVPAIDSPRLVLRPIDREIARELLEGRTPDGFKTADDYPSRSSLEVMDLIAGARADEVNEFGSFFMIRKEDGAVIGEIGSSRPSPSGREVHVGYSVVESCRGKGYATEALRALLDVLCARPDVDRVVAETTVDHTASRRVMEKAGLLECGGRGAEEDGRPVELVVYALDAPP